MLEAIQSERGVVAVACIFGELAPELVQAIEAEMVQDPAARTVFLAVRDLVQQKASVDVMSVSQSIRASGMLTTMSGQDRLGKFFLDAIPRENFGYHASAVRSAHFARKMVEQAKRLAANPDDLDIISSIQKLAVARDSESSDTLFDFSRDLPSYIDYLDSSKDRHQVLDTGFQGLDSVLGGCRPGDLTSVSGRPGGGKSAILTAVAFNLASSGLRVLMFSTEMGRFQVVDRMMPWLSRVFAYKFRRRNLEQVDYAAVREAAAQMHEKLILVVNDKPRPGILDFYRAAAKVKPQVVVIDYLQRCQRPKAENVTRSTDEFMTQLKTFALESKTWVLLGCQMNRIVDKLGKPTLSDLRDSGAIESESDQVVLLHSPEDRSRDEDPKITAVVEKNRHGRTGKTRFVLKRDFAQLVEVSTEDAGASASGRQDAPKAGIDWPKRQESYGSGRIRIEDLGRQAMGDSQEATKPLKPTGKEAASGEI